MWLTTTIHFVLWYNRARHPVRHIWLISGITSIPSGAANVVGSSQIAALPSYVESGEPATTSSGHGRNSLTGLSKPSASRISTYPRMPCSSGWGRRAPLRRNSGLLRRSRLSPISPRRKARLTEYFRKRALFLASPENQWCKVAMALWGKSLRTRDIHHVRGRYGMLLNDETHWLAVSREAHDWIHQHGDLARARGWLGS